MVNLDTLRPGDVVIYTETGSLARLRASTKRQPNPQIAAADAAWRLACEGRVDLVQRRCESGFQYLAIARREVDRQPVLPVLVSQGERRAA